MSIKNDIKRESVPRSMSTKEEAIMCYGPHKAVANGIYKRERQQAPHLILLQFKPLEYASQLNDFYM